MSPKQQQLAVMAIVFALGAIAVSSRLLAIFACVPLVWMLIEGRER